MSKTTRITEFEVCDLGIDHPDYFQGFGGSRYENSVVGIGTSIREALDDALETLAQYGNYDMEDLEERILKEHGEAPDNQIPWEDYDVQFDENGDPIDEEGNPTEYPELYYYIGIRWDEPGEDQDNGRTITLTINTGNAAFTLNGEEYETARILRDLAERITDNGLQDRTIRDINGNSVGKLTVTDN